MLKPFEWTHNKWLWPLCVSAVINVQALSFQIKSGKRARQERLSQSKNPAVRNCSSQQLHINAVITTVSADVNFLFIWLHLVCLNNPVGVLLPFALRKWLQTMRVIVYKHAHISCLTLFCQCKSVGFLLGLRQHECYVSGFEITVNKYIIKLKEENGMRVHKRHKIRSFRLHCSGQASLLNW